MELGVYREYTEVRKVALELAINSAALHGVESLATEQVIARADSYFYFLLDDV